MVWTCIGKQLSASRCIILHEMALQGITLPVIALPCSAARCIHRTRYRNIPCPIWYSTAQHSTAQHSTAQHRAEQSEGKSPLRQIQVGHQAAGGGQTWHLIDPQSNAPQYCCCASWGAAPPPHPPPPPAETAPHTLLVSIYTCSRAVHGVYTVLHPVTVRTWMPRAVH